MKDPNKAPETLKIIATHPDTQGAFVVINADDFDPATMQRFEEGAPTAKPAKAKAGSDGQV